MAHLKQLVPLELRISLPVFVMAEEFYIWVTQPITTLTDIRFVEF